MTNNNSQYSFSIREFTRLLEWDGIPAPGATVTLRLRAPMDPGRRYLVLASSGAEHGIPLPDGRTIPIDPELRIPEDPGGGVAPFFRGFRGSLDTIGEAGASVVFTRDLLQLLGPDRTLHVVFVTFQGGGPAPAPSSVKTISSRIDLALP